MRVTIIPPILEDEPFFSVRLYAANLVPALLEKGITVDQLEFSRRYQGWLPGRVNGPVNRYLLHPSYAAARQGPVNHILDHAYAHLAFRLDPR